MMKLTELKDLRADAWFFDNDGTLYDDRVIQQLVMQRMDQFFAKMHATSEEEGKGVRERLKKKWNTSSTVVALFREEIPLKPFIEDTYLSVDLSSPGLCVGSALCAEIPNLCGEKNVLTNSPSEFARYILKTLNIDRCISNVYGCGELGYVSKPAPSAYAPITTATRAGKQVVYIDDKTTNLKAECLGSSVICLHFYNGGLYKIGGDCENI